MQADELEETEQTLFKMSFTYWIVYCVAFYSENRSTDWNPAAEFEDNCCPVLLLTFACVLCLPLHRFAVRQ